jgi:hypothetical protein
MYASANSSVVDAFVLQADVAALRLARLAASRPPAAPGRPTSGCTVISLRDRREARARMLAQPSFPGDAA